MNLLRTYIDEELSQNSCQPPTPTTAREVVPPVTQREQVAATDVEITEGEVLTANVSSGEVQSVVPPKVLFALDRELQDVQSHNISQPQLLASTTSGSTDNLVSSDRIDIVPNFLDTQSWPPLLK